MSTFSEEALVKRLKELGPTQQSIQTLSLWLMHHRKHHKRITEVWLKVLEKQEKASAKLNLLYLANDVIQNSRRKGLDFPTSFVEPLTAAFGHIWTKHRGEKSILSSIERTISIWRERKIYDQAVLQRFDENRNVKESNGKEGVHKSKRKDDDHHDVKKKKKISPEIEKPKDTPAPPEKPPAQEEKKIEIPPEIVNVRAPELSDVIRAILALENAPSADAVVREKIANLPFEVRDVSALKNIQDSDALDSLKKQVDDACELLETYNKNLDKEIADRGRLSDILHDFRRYNNVKVEELVTELDNYNLKLQNAITVRDEVRNHAEKLPDMSKLPNVTQGRLKPLPTAGDLFTK